MTQIDIETARRNMIEQQIRTWEVLDTKVLDVLLTTPREEFVPDAYRALAFSDLQIPLGSHEVMMEPKVEGRLLQALDPKPNETVLELGTGSGYVTACLARMAASVHSIERIEAFKLAAQQRLNRLGIENCVLRVGDGVTSPEGWQWWFGQLRYDLVAITGALYEVPQALLDALSLGGRLFVITGKRPAMTARLYTRIATDEWSDEGLFETALPYLAGGEPPVTFEF